MKSAITTLLTGLLVVFSHQQTFAQADLCSGAPLLTINNSCVASAYNVSSGMGNEITNPTCGTSYRDGWYRFTTSATQSYVSISASTNRDVGLAIYSGTCGSLVQLDCIDAFSGSTTETLEAAVTPGTTYYLRVFRANNATANNMTGNICIWSPQVTSSCSTTSLDPGGAGNYAANTDYYMVYCPTSAGQCVSAAFTAFNTESGYDFLEIYDGNSVFAPQVSGSPFSGTGLPGTITASTSNSSGCLTFHFTSDGSTQRAGWSANISCGTCATATPQLAQDCFGGTTVCNDASFLGNSSGSGNDQDLTADNEGCLTNGEHQSSWYYFSPSANGTIGLNITPSDPTDDYDFAIWGPLSGIACPPNSPPIRCSYAGTTGTTGLNASAGTQTSEGAGGDGFVATLDVVAGQKYMLLVDNYSTSSSPFTLDWVFSSGASLNCTVLDVQLTSYTAVPDGDKVKLNWQTQAETNNHHFTIERSGDGMNFSQMTTTPGAGTTNEPHSYQVFDMNPLMGTNYYRLLQTDIDGRHISYGVLAVDFAAAAQGLSMNVFPVPAHDLLQVNFDQVPEQNTQLYIYDITGRIVLTQPLNSENGHTHSIKVGDLGHGVYFVKAENQGSGKKSDIKKIIIE